MTCPNSVKTGHWPLSHLPHPLEAIRQFTPNWFAATMGTGVLALALAQWPAEVPGLHQVAEGFWWLTIALFLLFTAMYTARWVLFFDEARRIFGHSTVSMFFGTIPMGLATIINGLLVFGMPRWGDGVVEVAQLLWWLDVAMSLACGILIPYMMFTRQEHSIDQMTAVWLLPVVAAEVAAASGGLLAPHLLDAHGQLVMLSTSYVLWAFSLPVAFSILTILLLRMALHKLPHESMAASSWLALGPIGTGALGMLVLGADAPAIFAANGLPGVGEIAAGLGLVAGLTLWGFGLWWMLMAVLITRRYLREGIPFNLGWWGFTFPLGVYSLATLKLGSTLHLGFFSVFGAVLVAALAVMWLIVAKRTVQGAYKGELFVSPCIAGLRK
ncbi:MULTISPECIES: TDT family transporter [Pseudomonas]|jgi:C4-dicarboxylate transporter/malic acid transport protein|uniref:TDT family transporter n=1 Tax=Pseudomonas TaxID=286 RepID=UPI00098D0CDF|nr:MULTISPECIES: TDT family transporter [Pseudomonas]GED74756.1 C4-dicarboxylate ABC transporter [Pseudomonas fluorescens]AQT11353.1 C4-dicarboxylate transporter/malic acid transport protein [Pseudomonas protegens]MCS4262328.1 C4-dicarboxylate transporter/malic acid transport protein [Pseudomonas sp. BIGb0176]MDS9874960.1 TDT family transporter [Pseudomonas protegens]MDT3420922.1 C4-dicarboxylate transporter/malic acid transport protein [Pseudomonas protegens]